MLDFYVIISIISINFLTIGDYMTKSKKNNNNNIPLKLTLSARAFNQLKKELRNPPEPRGIVKEILDERNALKNLESK